MQTSKGPSTSEVVKKDQHRLHFEDPQKKKKMARVVFYRCSITSINVYCISLCFVSWTVAREKELQRVINIATKKKKTFGHPSPLWRKSITLAVLRRYAASWKTAHTRDTMNLSCCRPAGYSECWKQHKQRQDNNSNGCKHLTCPPLLHFFQWTVTVESLNFEWLTPRTGKTGGGSIPQHCD